MDNLGLYVTVHLRPDTSIRAIYAGSASAAVVIEADPTTDVRIYFPSAPALDRLAAAVAKLRAAIAPQPDPLPDDDREPAFYYDDMLPESVRLDLARDLNENEDDLVGIVSRDDCGIMAYALGTGYASEIVDALNAKAAGK